MSISRYGRSSLVKGGTQFGTSKGATAIYYAVRNGNIPYYRRVTKEGERLDIIAGEVWGNASLWWVIAAASGIGWGTQVPPGVVLRIPSDLQSIAIYV